MAQATRMNIPVANRFDIPGTDLVVKIEYSNDELCMTVDKAHGSVYRLVIENASIPIEHTWLAEMFMRDERFKLGSLSAEVVDYVDSLNISQG